MNKKYAVRFSSRVDNLLLKHTEFLSRVSVPAAKRFRSEYAKIIERLSEHPFQFPMEEDLTPPENQYRRAVFYKRYKVLFFVEKHTVYVDAIVDCRMDGSHVLK